MLRLFVHLRKALVNSLDHDVLGTAKAAAYSAILCVFPALLVLTALIALTPDSNSLRGEVRAALDEVLPADTMNLAQAYLQYQHQRSVQVLFSAVIISTIAAMGVMLSLMEGFLRAYELAVIRFTLLLAANVTAERYIPDHKDLRYPASCGRIMPIQ